MGRIISKAAGTLGALLLAAGLLLAAQAATAQEAHAASADTTPMYRLYNKWSTEHLFTSSKSEYDNLVKKGWTGEGTAWLAPTSGDPVYRLYNKWSGDHHYTTSKSEYDKCVRDGWKGENVAFYSGGNQPVYRLFNPYVKSFFHHYTAGAAEQQKCIKAGWKDEKVGWYGYSAQSTTSKPSTPGAGAASNPWDGVKIILPESIGDFRWPENRMKVVQHSFRPSDSKYSQYYYMDVEFKCVQLGHPLVSGDHGDPVNWGQDVLFRNSKGAIIGKSYMSTYTAQLNQTYIDDLMVPFGTTIIEFQKHPDTSSGTGGGDEEALELAEQLLLVANDATKAVRCGNDCMSDLNTMYKNQGIAYVYYQIARSDVDSCKTILNSIESYVVANKSLSDTYGEDWTTLLQESKAAVEAFCQIEVTDTDSARNKYTELASAAREINVKTAAFASKSLDYAKAAAKS